ncbi:MAG: polysaccharide biosynthesis/export family protein [Tepidisphaeraceae bacterium]
MRQAQLTRHSSASSTRRVSTGVIVFLALLAGCETNSFLDPSEMGRYKKQPLFLPILTSLNTGIEETDVNFANATNVRPEDLLFTPSDYTIGRGDFIAISISDLNGPGVETVKQMRVTDNGKISLPLVGQLQAEGLTEAQLETAVQQAYGDAQLIKNAQVSVTVLEARARTFSIIGQVGQAGQYAIVDPDFRLMDAMVLARDTTSTGIQYIYVYRKIKPNEGDGYPTVPTEGTKTPAPTTGPSPDVLMPRSQLPEPAQSQLRRVSLLIQPADEPTTQPAEMPVTEVPPATQPGESEGRIVIIDGKAVPLEQAAEPSTEPLVTTPGAPETAPATKAFEFNQPQEPTNIRIIRVPYEDLRNGQLKYNIVVRGGDLIYVPLPVIGEYYMGGHVGRVGVYSLTARKITLKQAVISAGMLDPLAIPQRTQIVRRLPGRDREIFARVDLAKIFAGQLPDIYLKPEDQVMVGTNALAPFIAAIRNGFRITYGFGFLYDRNYWDPGDNNNNF